MTLERSIANIFQMDDQTWLRHANLWSGWTRLTTILPLLILAIWSRVWLGWWSLIPVTVAVLWMWLNPRVFPKPRSTNNWISKGVLGERVWLNRDEIPVPEHHKRVPNILSTVSGLGIPFLVWGIVNLQIYPTLLGATLAYSGKLWFIDRMVWLYEDMKDADPRYRSWLY